MSAVAALYRYPVKGMTPEPRDRLTVLDSGAIAGDRVLGLAFAGVHGPTRGSWYDPRRFVVLKNTPGLTRLNVCLDPEASRLHVGVDGTTLVDEGLDEAGRGRIASALQRYVLSLDENPLRGHPQRLPVRLIGDPATPAFADHASRHISLIGRASLEALADAMGEQIDERRFRANVMIEGIEPWEEFGWVGRPLRIGEVDFEVAQPIVRCVATHANPDSGERDLDVMKTLTSAFGQDEPTMGVLAVPRGGGELALGHEVTVLG